jgi:hypothetical protein
MVDYPTLIFFTAGLIGICTVWIVGSLHEIKVELEKIREIKELEYKRR